MRIKNVLRNSFFGIIAQIVLVAAGFFYQRTLNLRLGEALVGVNGVASNVISLLSVTELGIATAVVYHLYGALAKQDEEQIAGLMNLYRRAYQLFACVLIGLGMLCLPFIPRLMKDSGFSNSYLRIVFLLWLIRTAVSYLLAYKRAVLVADQKEYAVTITTMSISVLSYLSAIAIVEWWQNYLLALAVNIVIEVAINLVLIVYVNRRYPFLKRLASRMPEKQTIGHVLGDVKNIFVSRIAAKLLLSTDNLIISGAIGTVTAGLYSNYSLITQSVFNVILSLSGAVQPSIGNMFVEKDNEKNYQVLRQITFVFFLLTAFIAVCLYSLTTPFVSDIWLNSGFQLSKGVLSWMVINTGANTVIMPISMMMAVSGLFKKERNLTVLSAVANLAASLALVIPLGLIGVLIGTLLAYFVQFGFRVYYFFKDYLQRSCLPYLAEVLQYCALAIGETYLAGKLTERIYRGGSLLRFAVIMGVCVVLPNAINLILYCRSWRFRSIINLLRITLLRPHKMENSNE